MNTLLCGLLCVYALLKNIFGYHPKRSDNKANLILRIILILLTLLICLLAACVLFPFMVYYKIVDIYLKIKLDNMYGGILKGQDTFVHSIPDRIFIRTVLIFNENKQRGDALKSIVEKAKNLYLSTYKVQSSVSNCFGYYYYHKNQVKFEEILEQRRIGDGEYITKDEFIDYINQLPHTKDEKRVLMFQYFPQPILWNNKSKETRQYAIIISAQHCVSDGPNAMTHLLKYFMEDSYQPPQTNSLANLKNFSKFSIDDAYVFENLLQPSLGDGFPKASTYSNNNLHKQHLAVYCENTVRYLSVIKKVKTKLNVGFTSVIMGALVNSLSDHLMKNGKPMINMAFLTTIRPEEVNLIFKSSDREKPINDIGMQVVKIPAKQASSDMFDNIRAINEYLKRVRHSVDSTMIYLSSYLYFLPTFIQRLLIDRTGGITLVASNMSGVKGPTLDGHDLEAACFYVSHKQDLSFMFCVMSLGGRLQISLLSSDRYVSSREELQNILNQTLEYLDVFAKTLNVA